MSYQWFILLLPDERSSGNGLACSAVPSFVCTGPSRFSITATTHLFIVSKSLSCQAI